MKYPFQPARISEAVALRTADANGVKTSFATAATAQQLLASDGDFDGADMAVSGGVDGALTAGLGTNVSITTSSSVGTYTLSTIVVKGVEWGSGRPISVDLTLTAANGGETITDTTRLFQRITSVYIPAMNDASGAFELGTGVAVGLKETEALECDTTGGSPILVFSDQQNSDPVTRAIAKGAREAWSVRGIFSLGSAAGLFAMRVRL